jgi:hypothetical protein
MLCTSFLYVIPVVAVLEVLVVVIAVIISICSWWGSCQGAGRRGAGTATAAGELPAIAHDWRAFSVECFMRGA